MAQTIRFPEALKTEATAYAESLGVSLNALCAIALRDYLDARKAGTRGPAGKAERRAARPAARDATAAPAIATTPAKPVRRVRKQSLNSLCACGSGLKFKRCHGQPTA